MVNDCTGQNVRRSTWARMTRTYSDVDDADNEMTMIWTYSAQLEVGPMDDDDDADDENDVNDVNDANDEMTRTR